MSSRAETARRVAAVKDRLAVSAVAQRLGLRLRRTGREFTALCPFHSERSPSFTVVDGKGFYHCFGCGAHGDVLSLAMQLQGVGFREALEWLEGLAGLGRLEAAAQERARQTAERRRAEAEARELRREAVEESRDRERVLAVWRGAGPIEGSLAEGYLARRLGVAPEDFTLVGGLPLTLRFHRALDYFHEGRRLGAGPALVAAVQGPGCRAEGGGQILGVHCTWLAEPGSSQEDGKGRRLWGQDAAGKPLPVKKMYGRAFGGALRLTPGAETVVVGEGIETTLALWMAAAEAAAAWEEAPLAGFWAALSLNNLAGPGAEAPKSERRRHPERRRADGRPLWLPSVRPDLARPGLWLPEVCETLVIAEDNDNRDPLSAGCLYARAEERARAEGRRVRRSRPPAGLDFCDLYAGTAA